MIYFVSGTDTDVGKSIATGWLAARWQADGQRVITQKTVQTGNTDHSEDIARHREMMGRTFPEDAEGLTAPAVFSYPCSPHLAARLDGRELDLSRIEAAAAELDTRYDTVLLEGAGGLMVPLKDDLLTIDWVAGHNWPVIFVTGGILGSINHTLLAFETMKARGLRVVHVIYNRFPGRADRVIDDESCAYLRAAAARYFPDARWEEMPDLQASFAAPAAPAPAVSARPERRTFPANLLLENRTVLVAGGGRVGLRKTRSLLEAGARVRLVCPDALPEFASLPVEHRQKPFTANDLIGCRAAIACTDSKQVNRAILEAARSAGVLCCCADGHWAEGDFIVPASFRTDSLLVSVSTNGRSCRTAKEVKESLSRSLAACSPGILFVHGIDRAVPLPEGCESRFSFLNGLFSYTLIQTCNRTELLAWAAPELIESGLLTHALHLPKGAYTFTGEAARKHLAFVLAGMKSRMIGECHIVGQIRDAVDAARQAGHAHHPFLQAYTAALTLANRIRSAVRPHIPEVEVETLALEGATGGIVIAGTGMLGRAAAAKAHAMGLDVTLLYHRNPLPGERCLPLERWREALPGATRFLSMLSTPEPLFNAAEIGLPVYDLSVPRSVSGESVIDLDTLRNAYLERTGSLQTILAAAETVYKEFHE